MNLPGSPSDWARNGHAVCPSQERLDAQIASALTRGRIRQAGFARYRICYNCDVGEDEWEIYQTDEVAAWMEDLRRTDPQAAEKVEAAVDVLSEHGPTLGRPLVDTLTGSKIANLKELRPRQTTIRVLFVFDPWRSAILLIAGDKAGQWKAWYDRAIPQAEELYAVYLKERAKEQAP